MARVYLPMTLGLLRRLHDDGRLPDVVERLVAATDGEEDEYAALEQAADDSAALLVGVGRRIVVVAEVADADGPVGLSDVVAVHADDADVDPTASRLPELGWWATQEIPDLIG